MVDGVLLAQRKLLVVEEVVKVVDDGDGDDVAEHDVEVVRDEVGAAEEMAGCKCPSLYLVGVEDWNKKTNIFIVPTTKVCRKI